MGKMDTQRGQKLTLGCSGCRRPLGIFYNQKSVSSTPKIVVLAGSVNKTEKGTYKIHATCKCGAKTVFENSTLTRHGWRKIKSIKPE
ncbi:MAG: hypothetical protein CW716_05115 [Candidatus Bathyarchaeum sp.]|nr:MAG: hypothetical protein CW716_05115 [Candidatus Bathyarchaeum sp.]